jgi:carboxypeptidase C (cathepsin A)
MLRCAAVCDGIRVRRLLNVAAALALLAISPAVALAEVPHEPAPAQGVAPALPPSQTTDHSIDLHGRKLLYQARAGVLSLPDGDGAVAAEVFYVAYSVRSEPPSGESHRPITFVFNGGPGAASAFLHLGALGPRIVETSANGLLHPASHGLVDNPDTWLDLTDLVFVDPVGTGYSREAAGHQTQSFWSVRQDTASMAAFIRLYLAEAGRGGSPVFLVGESYGGFRVALLARTLQQDRGLRPAGIVLISPALEFMLVRPDEFDLLHLALELPSLAAVRLHHEGIAGPAFQQRLSEVERFALGDYLVALTGGLEQGGSLASERVAEFTGLPLELVRRRFARISTRLFAKEFARARQNVLSLYDGTVEATDVAPNRAQLAGPDPVLDRSVPLLTSAFVAYVGDELNFHASMSYRLLNGDASRQWDYGTGPSRQGYAGAMDDLQRARAATPGMRVLIVNGYTDLVTPYMTSRYLVGQVRPIPGATPVRLDVLDGGHMMYFRPDSRHALKESVSGLYQPAR